MEEAQIPYEIYNNVKQNPTIENVQSGVKKFAVRRRPAVISKDSLSRCMYFGKVERYK
ncbi:hypothetical protein [Pelosinus fermentans]|uniref:hypothetical protein n=1 Tax=Pelosinus sp. HCF1 TaxID=1235479 RepID=UPI00030582DB